MRTTYWWAAALSAAVCACGSPGGAGASGTVVQADSATLNDLGGGGGEISPLDDAAADLPSPEVADSEAESETAPDTSDDGLDGRSTDGELPLDVDPADAGEVEDAVEVGPDSELADLTDAVDAVDADLGELTPDADADPGEVDDAVDVGPDAEPEPDVTPEPEPDVAEPSPDVPDSGCAAGAFSCEGDLVVVCAPDGSWQPLPPCPAPETCVDGACACAPACEGVTCGSDGCGGSCGECVSGEQCVLGACVVAGEGEADSFELGASLEANGWSGEGQAAVVEELGETTPTDGELMLELRSQAEQDQPPGSAAKIFDAEPGTYAVRFYLKVYSEEFKEYCGSAYQDSFTLRVTTSAGLFELPLFIDDFCGPEDGSCGSCPGGGAGAPCDPNCMAGPMCSHDPATGTCSGVYACECGKYHQGLQPADVTLDQGGVFMTPWFEVVFHFPALTEPGPVEVVFVADGLGDSIFQTLALVDAVALLTLE